MNAFKTALISATLAIVLTTSAHYVSRDTDPTYTVSQCFDYVTSAKKALQNMADNAETRKAK
jgi:hypothetical protein